MWKFKSIIKGNLGAIIVVAILTLIRAFFTLIIPFAFSYLSEDGIRINSLIILFLLICLSLCINILLIRIEKKNTLDFKTKMNLELYELFFKIKYKNMNQNGVSYYINKIDNAVNHYANLVLNTIPMFINIWVVVLVCIWFIGRISILMLVILGGMLLIQNLGFRYLNKELSRRCIKMQDITAKGYSNIHSICDNIDYIKQKDRHAGILRLMKKDIYSIHKINAEVNAFAGNVSEILNALVSNLQYFMYILLGYYMATGRLETRDFVVIVMVVDICFSYVSRLIGMNINMKDVNASYDFIEKELKGEAEREQGQIIDRVDHITFIHTLIGYDELTLLEDVNLQLNRGDVVFISAETGTGKSSLVKTLVCFYQAKGIWINDIPMDELSPASVRKKIFYMSQQASIICGSLADNIYMGDEITDRDELERELASLTFLKKFTEADRIKDMDIQPGGTNLSGGDKQKVMISRLFVEDPDVLILDEITSSMDVDTSNEVFDEIIKRFGSKIILIISHNEELKRYANRFIRIENHKIIEEGGDRLSCR